MKPKNVPLPTRRFSELDLPTPEEEENRVVRRRNLIARLMGFGPAVAWFLFAVWRWGPTRGYWPVLGLALFVGVGVLGLTAVFVAYFRVTVERFGFRRFGGWLRTWWDQDAK